MPTRRPRGGRGHRARQTRSRPPGPPASRRPTPGRRHGDRLCSDRTARRGTGGCRPRADTRERRPKGGRIRARDAGARAPVPPRRETRAARAPGDRRSRGCRRADSGRGVPGTGRGWGGRRRRHGLREWGTSGRQRCVRRCRRRSSPPRQNREARPVPAIARRRMPRRPAWVVRDEVRAGGAAGVGCNARRRSTVRATAPSRRGSKDRPEAAKRRHVGAAPYPRTAAARAPAPRTRAVLRSRGRLRWIR